MSLTRNCYIRVVELNQLTVIGDAGRRLYTTMGRSTLSQVHVQGWKFPSLFLRLCWFHVPVTIGIAASIFFLFNNQQISRVARGLIQAISKSLGVCVPSFGFLTISDLVPFTLWLAFGTNPVPVSTFSSTKSPLTLWIGSLCSRWNPHQVGHMAST